MRLTRTTAVIFVLSFLLLGAITYGVITSIGLSNTKSRLADTTTELSNTRVELSTTQNALLQTRGDLESATKELLQTKNDLLQTTTQLNSTKQELLVTINDLTQANSNLSQTKNDLLQTTTQLNSTKQKLDNANQTLRGLGITVQSGERPYEEKTVDIIDNPKAVNPTWSQLIQFLSTDRTYQHQYIEHIYDCTEFSRDMHNNAEASGIKCLFIQIDFDNTRLGHDVVAFMTTDYGLVYVNCTEHNTICRLEKGKTYRGIGFAYISPVNIRNNVWWDSLPEYWYLPNDVGGEATTKSIEIHW